MKCKKWLKLIIRFELHNTSSQYVSLNHSNIFTKNEISYCRKAASKNVQSQRYAARFAVKEAFFKALGTGLRDGLRWKDVETCHDGQGKPYLELKNKAQDIIRREKISNILLSISHSKNNAVAVVILEKT